MPGRAIRTPFYREWRTVRNIPDAVRFIASGLATVKRALIALHSLCIMLIKETLKKDLLLPVQMLLESSVSLQSKR